MTRKPLPKAIRQPFGEARAFGSAGAPATPQSAVPYDKAEAEPKLAVSSAPIANDRSGPAPKLSHTVAAQRRALAHRIVARHKNYAAVGGLVPLPVVNIATVTAVNLRMVKQLSELYEIPFERDRMRAMIVGLIGGAAPTAAGTATTSTLMWIVPGGLLWGMGVSAVTAGAITRGIGLVFVESFEGGAA